jgi:hypothetical protein
MLLNIIKIKHVFLLLELSPNVFNFIMSFNILFHKKNHMSLSF